MNEEGRERARRVARKQGGKDINKKRVNEKTNMKERLRNNESNYYLIGSFVIDLEYLGHAQRHITR